MYDENATYDPELQDRALRLIMAHCPGQAANAADALRSRSDAGRQARLDRIIPIALRDAATWSIPDRELLARAMSPAAKTVLEIPDPAATTPGGGILTDHNLGVSVLVPPTAPAGPGDADAQVEAVLDVLAPKSEAVWFTDQDPAEHVRVPIIRLEYQGQAVMPNDEQMHDLARAIVTAIRTASGPGGAALTAAQVAAVLPVLRGEYSAQHDEATEEACLAEAARLVTPRRAD